MKNIIANVCIVLFSVIVSFAIFELFLVVKSEMVPSYDIEMWKYSKALKVRSLDPRIGHVHKKNASANLQNVDIRINGLGLRGDEVNSASLAEKETILFLGSSILLGWGVEEQDTFPVKVQELLEANGRNVVALNAGVGNYNAERYVTNFFENLSDLEPKRIVVAYFVNDSESLSDSYGNVFTRNFQSAVLIWKYLSTLESDLGIESIDRYYRKQYDPSSLGFKNMSAALNKLSAYCVSREIPCSLVMLPDIHQLNPYKLGFIHEKMQAISAEIGFKFLDLLPYFEGEEARYFWNDFNDPHPNKHGHEVIARAIVEKILQ
jgi:hypothetical protein